MNQLYLDSARLLTRVAPLVLVDDTFALKGGTAINLFIRDMPRLSVDLDLVFRDHTLPRKQALNVINEAIRQSAARLQKQGFHTHAPPATASGETKLLVRSDGIEVKIEANFVMRGTVHPVHSASLTPNAREMLQADLEIPVVSLEDVYGGKLVAAMDRQHPRDLFDILQLFAHEGITPGIRRAFVVYLASHNQSWSERSPSTVGLQCASNCGATSELLAIRRGRPRVRKLAVCGVLLVVAVAFSWPYLLGLVSLGLGTVGVPPLSPTDLARRSVLFSYGGLNGLRTME
ncbi:MAG TPA: nucleotidyl transferase AbiEii/AbiGii toxin family protein, partial [Chloroflexota bacterium]